MSVAVAAEPALDSPGRVRAERSRGLVRSRPWRVAGLLLSTGVLAFVALCSVAVGTKPISFATVVESFTHYDPASSDHLIIRSLRLPRTEIGLLVGSALGAAGAVMQGVARNPLADPGLLGVDAGAALFVVVAIYTFGVGSLLGYVWFAFAGPRWPRSSSTCSGRWDARAPPR